MQIYQWSKGLTSGIVDMHIQAGPVKYYVKHYACHQNNKPIVLLHGFTGSSESYDHISKYLSKNSPVWSIDLIGHGKTESPDVPNYYRLDSQLEQLNALFVKLELKCPILLGYSMGGRLALNYAINFPDTISGLILESTNTGIENESDRRERQSSDSELSNEIRENYSSFLEKWNRLPLFKSSKLTSSNHMENFKKIQKQQNSLGLAHSISQFSTAFMPYISNRLYQLSKPILIITGEEDRKYTDLWIALSKHLTLSKHEVIQNAGHRVHLDNPDDYIMAIENYITEIKFK
jgi:2-succinyl-6-hydroxy-2,4-cyclohexadiene-1-carboxylate synthase